MMKRYTFSSLLAILALGVGMTTLFTGGLDTAIAQIGMQAMLGTGFTYQGYLSQNDTPVDGSDQCDGEFSLWDAETNGNQLGNTQTILNIDFNEGYFTVELNSSAEFGATPFSSEARWLEIDIRCPAGSGIYTTLGRHALTATPYAHYSLSTNALQGRVISDTVPATGQVLQWDGNTWSPGTVDASNGVHTISSDTTLDASHQGLILVTGNTTVTLPTTAIDAGTTYTINNVDATGSTVTIAGTMSDKANPQLGRQYASLTVVYDGANWHVIGEYIPPPGIFVYVVPTSNGNLGGRAGADALCSSWTPEGFTNFHALISVDTNDEIRDMPNNYGIPPGKAITGIDADLGDLVAENWNDLLDGDIEYGFSTWWSGSNTDGSLHANHCNNWTSTSGNGRTGAGYTISDSDVACNGGSTPPLILCLAY